jgi:AAA+ ATPase superfamily predicted ATPase
MVTDPALLLHDQLKDPQVYESILSAIAAGFHSWGEIAKMSGIGAGSNPSVYIKNLQTLELVENRDPVLTPPTGRKGRYYIRDPFLRFYYSFILPQRTYIQRGEKRAAMKAIADSLRAFVGAYVFEELCREWVLAEGEKGALGFVPEEVGSFWTLPRGHRQAVQLDVVAASRREKRLLIGEAKWGAGSVPRQVLTDLVERSKRMPQVTDEDWTVQYILFAREGFTPAAVQAAKGLNARLVNLAQLEARLVEYASRPHVALPDDLRF